MLAPDNCDRGNKDPDHDGFGDHDLDGIDVHSLDGIDDHGGNEEEDEEENILYLGLFGVHLLLFVRVSHVCLRVVAINK